MSSTRMVLTLLGLLGGACASAPEPRREPPLGLPTPLELFRRARFEELVREDPEALTSLARLMRSSNVSVLEDFDDLQARAAYRRGELEAAKTSAALLSADNKTRRLIEVLVARVDPLVPVRESHSTKRIVELPLAPRPLDRGYAVIPVEIDGKPFRVLWDTGATDNVLSPAAADALELPLSEAKFTLPRRDGAFVVRLAASVTRQMRIGAWLVRNIPWLVSDLGTVDGLRRDIDEVDGFVSPQLLLPNGCFAIDRFRAVLRLGFGEQACRTLMEGTGARRRLYAWDGELFVSGRVASSPELALRVETGSPISFLRTHAARYLPRGVLEQTREAGIARQLDQQVAVEVAGRRKLLSSIDLDPAREGAAHDEIATLGNDLLLQGRGVALDFVRQELGTLDVGGTGEPGSAPR